jgi:hypothetical protein
MRCLFIAVPVTFMTFTLPAFAWDGIDVETGENVEIERGNLVRSGRDIEVYNHATGEYHEVTVEDIDRRGSAVEIEVYDYETGEYRTFEFQD